MITKESIKDNIEGLVHRRVSLVGLRKRLQEYLGVDVGLAEHYNNGKDFLNNEIVDDFYSFDVEYAEGKDAYILIYFFPTNEEDVIFVSEVSIEFNEWK